MNYYRNINSGKIHFDFLCVNEKPVYYQEIIDKGSRIFIIPGRRKYFAYRRQLSLIFKKNKYDGIWSNRCSLPGTVPIFKAAYKHNVPLRIIHAHNAGNMGSIINALSHGFDKYRIKKYATDFWACSAAAGRYFYSIKTIQSAKFKIIHNAIDAGRFGYNALMRNKTRNELKINDRLVIGHIGRFHFQKNHNFLLRVFREISKKNKDSLLLLIGEGELKGKIERSVKKYGLADNVRFLGVRGDIPELLNAMDIFLFPSKFEGLGMVLIESQAAALYSIASSSIPLEVKITDYISFVSLNKNAKEWADVILKSRNYARKNVNDDITNAGYNITVEAKKLEEFFLNITG
jgi:glycosyltransferase involved in cell wall biosynthesis